MGLTTGDKKGLTIGYDGKRAVKNNTGLGNYSRLVIEQMARNHPHYDLRVYTPTLSDNPRLSGIRSLSNVSFATSEAKLKSLWRTFGMTRQLIADGIDIYHGLSNELPLNIAGKVPSVVTIHDVIYRRLPYCYSPIDRCLYDIKYGRSAKIADRVIAVSERTKLDVMHYYGVPEDKIDVVYQGCDNSFQRLWSDDEKNELRARLQLPGRYILQVGTIERRKNLELTVRALADVDEAVHLVAVGRDRLGYRKKVEQIAREAGIPGRIHFYDRLAFSDLPGVCQCAEVIAYPSHYEGFGIPVLEGLESRRPVIAATGSCLEEAGGDAAIYVNPNSPREMAEALRAVINREANIKAMINRGLRHAERFNTDEMSDKITAVYEHVLRGCR